MKHIARRLTFLVLLALPGGGTAMASGTDSLAECDAELRARPGHVEAYACYPRVAARSGAWSQAAARLEGILAVRTDEHYARLALAGVVARFDRERAERLYREAAAVFTEEKNAKGELHARLDLANFLALSWRLDEADQEIARARDVAEREDDPLLHVWVRTTEGWQAWRRSEYDRAVEILTEIDERVLSAAPVPLRSSWLSAMGAVYWAMGRNLESLAFYRRQAALMHEVGWTFEEATALSNVALLTSRALAPDGRPSEKERQTVSEIAAEALVAAQRGGNRLIEAKSHLYLGQFDPSAQHKRSHFESALRLYATRGRDEDRLLAMRLLGESLVMSEPRDVARAYRLVDESLKLAESWNSLLDIARARIVRAEMDWILVRDSVHSDLTREQAIVDSLAALDAIEAIREKQKDEVVRARTFSWWAFAYYRLAGHLLWPPEEVPSPDDLELAFATVERMRSRVLLDELDAARVVLSGDDPDHRSILEPHLPSTGEVRAELRDGEALLSFQTADVRDFGGNFRGGAWLWVHTRAATKVYPLPGKSELSRRVELILGLMLNRDSSELQGTTRLYRDLLERGVGELDPAVTDLVIVPDGPLHRLPFAVLRPHADAEPLGMRYRISLAPSAGTWLHWRRQERTSPEAPALALVDPELASSMAGGSEEEGSAALTRTAHSGIELGPLPHARREARSIARHLGRGARSVEGAAATEQFLKASMAKRYAILHLAAHAVVNDQSPQKSAVVLASSGGDDDGLLTFSEVAGIDLQGSAVVLSCCRSASGIHLEGEGVLSLARAFFVAGSPAVVGSLWPLRDDEAAPLFDAFYREIGRGSSLAEALAAARRDRFEARAPAVAWAGLVLIGDGSRVPLPGGRPETGLTGALSVGVTVLLLAVVLATVLFFRRR
jgi:CHAT domain-containing protein